MAYIRSRKHKNAAHLAALIAVALPSAAMAVDKSAKSGSTDLPAVSVTAKNVEVPFKADTSANPKLSQPLLDTPQTVQVIKKEVLREQGVTSLTEALRNTPGITMQLGEAGNTSAGDTFSMRGFSTQGALFLDGIRDLGAINRDTFNLEQIEVIKGPAGADIGRGAASGYISLISKLPTRDSVNMVSMGLGTTDKKRFALDVGQALGETAALRLNLMAAAGDVDKRDVVNNSSYAIAPSFALGLGTPTRAYLYSQHIRQDNTPDGGIPTIGMEGFFIAPVTPVTTAAAAALRAGAKVNRSNFYGSVNDYEDVAADMVTAKIEHDLGSGTTIRNLSRYGITTMDRVLTSPQTLAATSPTNPATWTITRSRQRVDQENEILANQTSISTQFDLGGIKHSLVGGLEFMQERQKTKGFATAAQTINGVVYPAVINPNANLYNPNPNETIGIPYATGVNTDGSTTTAALYVSDTLQLSEQWQANASLRVDSYKTSTDSGAIVTAANAATFPGYTIGSIAPIAAEGSGNLLSYKLGALYKPAPNGSIYAAYATSQTPPGSANFALVTTANNQNNPALEPQKTDNIELGTKWSVLGDQLKLEAALFRTENSGQASFNDLLQAQQIGRTRVEGLELSAVGQLTRYWQLSAGLTKLRAKALDQRGNTGIATTDVRWTPDLTATLWTQYAVGDGFTIGGGGRYVSEQKRLVTTQDPATQNMPEIPAYWAADMMASYQLNKHTNVRLNVYNLFDKEYIETMNNNGGRVRLGLPRSAMLTAEFTF